MAAEGRHPELALSDTTETESVLWPPIEASAHALRLQTKLALSVLVCVVLAVVVWIFYRSLRLPPSKK